MPSRTSRVSKIDRWKKVVSLACSGAFHIYYDNKTTEEEARKEFHKAAKAGDLDDLEAALGIKKEGV